MTEAWSTVGRVRVGEPDQCWPWLCAVNNQGYGVVSTCDSSVSAHTQAFLEAGGVLPPGHVVDHLCHDPAVCPPGPCAHRLCCNPVHLQAVTVRENTLRGGGVAAVNAAKVSCPTCGGSYSFTRRGWRFCRACQRDAVIGYKERVRTGEQRIRTRKLTEEQIAAIANDTSPVRVLAGRYGVSVSLISEVRRGWVEAA